MDERNEPQDEPYEPPRADDVDTDAYPSVTAAGKSPQPPA